MTRDVLVVRNDLLPLSETFVAQQVRGLQRWHATLVGQRRIERGLDLSGLDVALLDPPPRSGMKHFAWRAFERWGLPTPRPLQRLFEQRRPQLAHVHFATDATACWPWLRHLRLPTVVTLHGYDIQTDPAWWHGGGDGPGMRSYPERLADMARHPAVSFIAVSKAVRERAVQAYGVPAAKIDVLHIGIDTRAFKPGAVPIGAREPLVLFVGRLVEKKGVDVLIRAMHRVSQRFAQARALIVGDGPLRGTLEQLARTLAAPVSFVGAQSSAQILPLLHQAYAFCLPSVLAANGDAEGFGLVLLEAQACGVPVVTSAVGGRDEGLLEGITGFAFAEHDDQALAERLCTLLGDPERATAMGIEARRFAETRFDLAHCTAALEQHYDQRVAA